MINLDKAKKLKEAGLKWEPKLGDFYQFESTGENTLNLVMKDNSEFPTDGVWTWLPRLDQLLVEIEQRWYLWKLHKAGIGVFMILYSGGKSIEPSFYADTSEDATANALLWILKQVN